MSTTYKYNRYQYQIWERVGTTNTYTPGSRFDGTVVLEEYQRPDTVYREKPIDLWSSGTARSVLRRVTSTSYGTQIEDGLKYKYTGKAATDVYPSSHLYMNGSINSNLPDRSAMLNQVRKDLRGKAVNLAMCIAEYKKTALLFRDAAKLLTTDVGSLVRGAAGTAKSSKEISRRWLQYQYGVKPLANDVLTLIELMKGPRVDSLYIGGRVQRRYETRLLGYGLQNSTVHSERAQVEQIRRGCYYTHYRAKFSGSRIRNTLITSGFANPFNLAWELIPFSFVVDWWINIGDVLASLDNLLLFDSLWVRESSIDNLGTYVTANNRNFVGNWQAIRTSTGRSAPFVVSLVNTFAWKPSVSYTHIANGTALLRTLRR